MSLQSRKIFSIISPLHRSVPTSFVFNECAHLLRMVDVAVVQHENASRTRVRIGKGDLNAALDSKDRTNKKHIPLVHEETEGNALK